MPEFPQVTSTSTGKHQHWIDDVAMIRPRERQEAFLLLPPVMSTPLPSPTKFPFLTPSTHSLSYQPMHFPEHKNHTHPHSNLTHRNHLLPQIVLILSNRAIPSPNRLILAHHDILGNLIK